MKIWRFSPESCNLKMEANRKSGKEIYLKIGTQQMHNEIPFYIHWNSFKKQNKTKNTTHFNSTSYWQGCRLVVTHELVVKLEKSTTLENCF